MDESDRWTAYFDGSYNPINSEGACGVVLIDPNNKQYSFSKKLNGKIRSNNHAEASSLLFCIETIIDNGINNVSIYGDNANVISIFNKTSRANDTKINNDIKKAKKLANKLTECIVDWVKDYRNPSDRIAKLANYGDRRKVKRCKYAYR